MGENRQTEIICPKVSIVIPVYNTQGYVRQTLESILAQTLSDIEIIVINDGSTDGSLQVIQEATSGDCRVIIHSQKNSGLSITRNVGISMARGEYIYFMDSDDLLEAETLQKCYDKCKLLNLDFLLFDADTFTEDDGDYVSLDYHRAHHLEDRVYTGIEVLTRLLDNRAYSPSACLNVIDMNYLRRIGATFYPNILHEDELFSVQLHIPAMRVGRIVESFFKRRMRAGSIMTSGYSERSITGYFTVLSEMKRYSAGKSRDAKKLISRLIAVILNAVAYNSHSMPGKDRMSIFRRCITQFPGVMSVKNMIVILFPSVKKVKNNF